MDVVQAPVVRSAQPVYMTTMTGTAISVRDIVRLALPPSTRVVAGKNGLLHQVTWSVMQRATLPVFAGLRGGELVLVDVGVVLQLDPKLHLATLARRLAKISVAGIVFLGEARPEDIRVADELGIPLLMQPPGSSLREAQREIERLFSDYEAQIERRGAQLYNALTQRSLSGDGIEGLLETVEERTGLNVAFYAANGEMRAVLGNGHARVALESLRPFERGDNSILDQHIWVEPVGNSGYPHGYLALAGGRLDSWDRLAAEQGAAALALELAKEQAVQAVEERLRGDFLSMVLAAPVSDPEALIQRGAELGYDLKQPFVAVLFHLDDASPSTLSRIASSLQNEFSRRNVAAPLVRREEGILSMCPVTGTLIQTRELAESLRERLAHDYPGVRVSMGNPAQQVNEWTNTVREAEQALGLGRQIFTADRVLAFGDLGVYRLLVLLREEREMWTFYRETLASLANYDQNQKGELLKTLDAYFNHLGNLRATSEALHVHRNTLLYRLERIEQITGFDLSNPEEHFALWLALQAHRVLSPQKLG